MPPGQRSAVRMAMPVVVARPGSAAFAGTGASAGAGAFARTAAFAGTAAGAKPGAAPRAWLVAVAIPGHDGGGSAFPGASSSYAGLTMIAQLPLEPTGPVSRTRAPGSSPGMCERP